MGTELFAVQVCEKCELDPANGLVWCMPWLRSYPGGEMLCRTLGKRRKG